jgi:hypothetical protein
MEGVIIAGRELLQTLNTRPELSARREACARAEKHVHIIRCRHFDSLLLL